MRARSMPAAAKNSGNSPHAMPSLRLLTSPAWLTLDRSRSRQLVRRKTSPADNGATSACRRDSAATWCRVSRTSHAESSRPIATNPTPR
ncbi:MAG: hypothetical protein A2579_03555 [Lysobacterales bacterium RIFOXYD1_FULL_69_11]|nr:MAG: hypothetical protein A2579_03555 [Xanthomonadales bacterium RIFOXYD1_FULL_69_11]